MMSPLSKLSSPTAQMFVGELPQMPTSRLVVGLGTLVHTKVGEDGAVASPQAVTITRTSEIAVRRNVSSLVDGTPR